MECFLDPCSQRAKERVKGVPKTSLRTELAGNEGHEKKAFQRYEDLAASVSRCPGQARTPGSEVQKCERSSKECLS